jgi:plastocyanin
MRAGTIKIRGSVPPSRRLPPLLVALALLAGGCGGSAPVAVRNRTLGLKLDEFRIVPQDVTAPAGRLRIIVRNRGVLTHNVTVEDIPSDPQAQPNVLGRTPTVHPGQRAQAYVTLRPGRYQLVCTIANHANLGMTGTLVVRG